MCAVLPKRLHRDEPQEITPPGYPPNDRHLILAAETLRASDTAHAEPAKTEEKLSMFWRVFGGTFLSITALVVITAYQSLAGGIHELRGDLTRLRETNGELVKKDEFQSRNTKLWDRLQELQAVQTTASVLSNKIAALEQQQAAVERDRRELLAGVALLPMVKDRVGALEDQRRAGEQDHKDLLAASAAVAAMKEHGAALDKHLKDAEAERKDLMRELQQLRERLAKLEGTLQEAKPSTAPKGQPEADGPKSLPKIGEGG
jgi:regulator of replication initiation timing